MNYEYNGNLLEDDRVNLVANEIVKKYKDVSFEKAREAAMLEGRLSNPKTAIDELNRLYNIMLVNCDNRALVSEVYKDFIDVLNINNYLKYDNRYLDLSNLINDYLQSYGDFPFLSDF